MCQAFYKGISMQNKIWVYNKKHNIVREKMVMPKKLDMDSPTSFGERMTKFRNAAGYTQRDLAKETGISQRMIAYYEKQSKYPPTHLLTILAAALGTSADELLGIENENSNISKKDMRLWRRFTQVEKMDTKEKKQILQILDTFIEKDQLKRKISTK